MTPSLANLAAILRLIPFIMVIGESRESGGSGGGDAVPSYPRDRFNFRIFRNCSVGLSKSILTLHYGHQSHLLSGGNYGILIQEFYSKITT